MNKCGGSQLTNLACWLSLSFKLCDGRHLLHYLQLSYNNKELTNIPNHHSSMTQVKWQTEVTEKVPIYIITL